MVVLWLNNFLPKNGVSDTLSPRQIVLGTKLDMKMHCCIEFGTYAQVYEEPSPTNSMEPRTSGCICLGLVDNAQGSMYFLKLETGEEVVRRQFNILLIMCEVIARVDELGHSDNIPTF